MKNRNRIDIDIDVATSEKNIPKRNQFKEWIMTVLKNCNIPEAEITIRVVDEPESAYLNQEYRHKKGPTNVLSFLLPNPHEKDLLSGDLVLCAPLVRKEAESYSKTTEAHWAHLVIHGVLHLIGYDHVKKEEAAIMEPLETQLLFSLGYANPYH